MDTASSIPDTGIRFKGGANLEKARRRGAWDHPLTNQTPTTSCESWRNTRACVPGHGGVIDRTIRGYVYQEEYMHQMPLTPYEEDGMWWVNMVGLYGIERHSFSTEGMAYEFAEETRRIKLDLEYRMLHGTGRYDDLHNDIHAFINTEDET